MRVRYDNQSDALYIELRKLDPGTAENRSWTDEITLDYGPDGNVAGIEVLDASTVLGDDLDRVTFEIFPVLRKRHV